MPRLRGSLAADAGAPVLHRDRSGGPGTGRRGTDGRAGLGEALLVAGLWALEALAVLLTYSRLEPEALYNVDRAGNLAGGFSRLLTILNYPVALVGIALAAIAGGPRFLVWASIGLCALVAVPGVVDQDDLDARWINALPALGLVLAVALTIVAARRAGWGLAPRARGDALRLGLGALLLVLALPWLSADLGFHLPGDLFLGEEVPAVRDPEHAAVHLGFHHGNGGVLLALSALLLSRIRAGRAVRAYLSLMLAYGLANAFQDAWNEQLWKREWVDRHLPDVLRPDVTWGWLVVVVGALAIYALWFAPSRER